MNAFVQGQAVEARSLIRLLPFLHAQSDGRYVLNSKGPLAKALQETVGDALFNDRNGELWSVEMKAEEEDRYGNVFLETWSNRNLDGDEQSFLMRGSNPGWFVKSTARLLLYHFLRSDDLYVVRMFSLRRWAFRHDGGRPRLDDFDEKLQGKYVQRNDTWGRCVPIETLMRECGMRKFNARQLSLLPEEAIAS